MILINRKGKDWLANNRNSDHEKFHAFRYTLDDTARKWFNDIAVLTGWNAMQAMCCRYLFTQDISIRHLHERWGAFKYNPNTDDIEDFISNTKETVHQLNHNDKTVLNLINTCLPADIYSFYIHHF